ncbi:asparagine synthetase B family protein [Acidisoma sp. 7E03]
MCAIVGLFTPQAMDVAELRRLAQGMQTAHHFRGPDGDGVWANEHVAIGSVRLAVVGDRRLGLQPLRDRWGGHLVFNGEIYEAEQILHALGERFHPEDSDGVALEALLGLKGPEALRGVRGFFAAARYEPKDGSLTLVRDSWGEKPLYLMRWRGGWAFASTIAALATLQPGLRIRAAAPHEYLVYKSVGGLQTSFEGIEQLAPGAWMKIHADGSVSHGRYAAWPEACAGTATAEEVRQALDAAIAARATDHFPNAVLLSGGADSSIVAASFARQRPDLPMRTFSIGYDVPGSEDETGYARRMAEHLGVAHEIVPLHAAQLPDLFRDAARLTEDPIADPVTLPTLLLARRVAQTTKVALSGDGSDEFWGGYARFDDVPASLDDYLRRTMVFQPEELGLAEAPASYLHGITLPLEGLDPLDRVLRLEAANRLRNYHLMRTDKLGMGAALEIRAPFLDAQVTALAQGLPATLKRPGGRPKGLLLDAYAEDLPDWLVHRRKQPFTMPILQWLTGDLRSYARDSLTAATSWTRGFVDTAAYLDRLDQAPTVETASRIWSLLQLEAWHDVWSA